MRVADDCAVIVIDFSVRLTVGTADVFVADITGTVVLFVAVVDRVVIDFFLVLEITVSNEAIPRPDRAANSRESTTGRVFIFVA